MEDVVKLPIQAPKEIPPIDTSALTIKIANSSKKVSKEIVANIVSSDVDSLSQSMFTNSLNSSSPSYSPSLISPPSSAFVSALQSPYISPRATLIQNLPPNDVPTPTTSITNPSPPASCSGSQSDDIPSTSYTPPPEKSDYSEDLANTKLRIVTCVPVPGPETAPRVSFSFPVPRISFAKTSISSASNPKVRSYDVYIGYHGQNHPNLVRFCNWLKSELEVQGIASFVADRASYSENQSDEIADRVICSVNFGVVVLTRHSLLNHLTTEEIRFFSQKKNLIPMLFGIDANEAMSLSNSKECKQALDKLMNLHEYALEASDCNWRSCISKAVGVLREKIGRKSVVETEIEGSEELPFPRNRHFVGREKEMLDIETAFFGCGDHMVKQESSLPSTGGRASGQSGGLADDECRIDTGRGRSYINLEVGNCKEPNLESWIEPINGRNSLKRTKNKSSKSGKYKSSGSSVVCINGSPGVGKTELALEFAYRYAQRYKMVFWIGGETRYLWQNIMNISLRLGLDVSADPEKERGKIRSFDEQETESFKRVKRELFRDMPYLLIIDNLESDKEWWEGKDLHDLIPANTGGTHVIVTTRLSRVMNFDQMQLRPLPLSDAMTLIQGRQKKEYETLELEVLGKFDEKLKRSSFGMSLVGSILTESAIFPAALLEAVNEVQMEEIACSSLSIAEQQFCRTNPFLMKVLEFCVTFLLESRNETVSRMLLVGAWLASAPVSANFLSNAAKNLLPTSTKRLKGWTTCLKLTLGQCSGCYLAGQAWTTEGESALLLVNLGLARKVNRQAGCCIKLHPITQTFLRWKYGLTAAKAAVQGVRKIEDPLANLDHLWASAFLVFGYKSELPLVNLKTVDMVLFIKKTALPLALRVFTTFSRCNAAVELLKVCTDVLEEEEKSFVSQAQDWCRGSLCWKKRFQSNQRVDEYIWKEVTLLKATLLETRAKLLLRGGHFDVGEELCRTCASIRTVLLGHNHAQTLAAQKTLAKLVRMRSKMGFFLQK